MKSLKVLPCAGAFAAATLAAPAAFAGDLSELSLSAGSGFESRYVFRGVQFAEESFQPWLEASLGNAYIGGWFNVPLASGGAFANTTETDLYAGYGYAVSDTVGLDVGLTWYTFPDTASSFFDDETNTLEFYAGASFDVPLAPSLYIYRDVHLDTTTIEGAAGYSFPIDEKTSFDIAGSIGVALIDDADDVLYGMLSADVAYAVTETVAATLGGRFGGSDTSGGSIYDGADSNSPSLDSSGLWWGATISASF